MRFQVRLLYHSVRPHLLHHRCLGEIATAPYRRESKHGEDDNDGGNDGNDDDGHRDDDDDGDVDALMMVVMMHAQVGQPLRWPNATTNTT